MIYPQTTLYPGDSGAYPSYSDRPWSYDATASSSFAGTATWTYSSDGQVGAYPS